MFSSSAFTSPFDSSSGTGLGSSSGFIGRDIIWVDLRFPSGVGNSGAEDAPLNTANQGLAAVPDGGTLVMVGGDASTEPGVTINARSLYACGLGGQQSSGGLTPVLPTLTYAITTATQRLAFERISVALVHAGTAASLTRFWFKDCPSVTLTASGDAPPVDWAGDLTCTFSGSGGPANLRGGNVAGYVANSGAIVASGINATSDLTSSSSITLVNACSFGGALSITAPTINIDAASLYNALTAGVTFSTTVHLLVPFGTPSDIGTANATGTATTQLPSDHVHRLTFTPVQTALGGATAPVPFNGQRLTGLGSPTAGTDAATKAYVDASIVGLKVKTAAVAVATANQATMSGTAQTVDGVALNTVGMRVLLTAQSTATQNGLWVVQSGAWTRPTDFATGSSAAQSYVLVTGGTVNAGSAWFDNNTSGSDVVDTNNLTWVLFSQPQAITAGAGLTKTGNTLDVVAGDATIVVHADDIVVGVIGDANLADNTIALSRLVNASAQAHFLARNSSGAGPWEDVTTAQAQALLGIAAPGVIRVRAATTASITLSGTQTVDGVALIAGDHCLAKNQGTASQNGPYVVAAGAWSRSSDAIFGGLLVEISEGTANGNRVAMLTTDDPITVGTTALTFAMDRIVPVASVAPANTDKSAAQIGTSVDGARADHKHDVSTAATVSGSVAAGNSASEGTATTLSRSDHGHEVLVAAPVAIGTSAAIGTATTLVRSDHVHPLTFAVAAAVLALATTPISVNSQKITNLATPTVSTDAATKGYVDSATAAFGAPANPGDNNKIAYANAGALAYASQIKTDGTYISTGANPAAGGTFRLSYNTFWNGKGDGTIVAGDVQLFKWGLSGGGIDNSLIWGDGTNCGAIIQNVSATGSYFWNFAGTGRFSFSSSAMTWNPLAATSGTAPVAFSVNAAAHTGLSAGTEPRDVTFNLARTVTLSTGAVTSARAARFQAPTYAFAAASTIGHGATLAVSGAPAAGTNATLTRSSALWLESGGLSFGATPAVVGAAKFTNNTAAQWRNVTGTADTLDIWGIGVDSTDTVLVGDTTGAAGVTLRAKSAGVVGVLVGAAAYSFGSSSFDTASKKITSLANGTNPTDAINLSQLTGYAFSSITIAGDVTGTLGATTVAQVNGAPVTTIGAANTLLGTTDGTHLTYFQLADAQISSTAAISLSKLAGGTALSVLGRSANSAGARADIAGTNNTVFRISGSVLGFGAIDLSTAQVTGVLPIANQAAQNMSGDVTGTTASSTVTKLQNRNFSSSAPTDGFVPTWDAGTSTWVTTGHDISLPSNLLKFGGTPSANALVNATGSGAGTTVLVGAKDTGGTDRAVLSFSTSASTILGNSAKSTNVVGQGGTWSFAATGIFPGVAHSFSTGGYLQFGVPSSSNGLINTAYNSLATTTILGSKDSGGVDRSLLAYTAADHMQLGASSLTTDVIAAAGTWTFGAALAAPGVEHNFASGAFLSYSGTHAGSGFIRGPNSLAFIVSRTTGGADLVCVKTDSSNTVFLGDPAHAVNVQLDVATGGTGIFAVNNVTCYQYDVNGFNFNDHYIELANVSGGIAAPSSGRIRIYLQNGTLSAIDSNGFITDLVAA